MRHAFLALASVVLVSSCALRPQYRTYVNSLEGPAVKLMMLERLSDKPVKGAKVELGELKAKVSVTSAADGTFTLPMDKKYFDDNALLVVSLPEGQDGYRLILASEYKRRCGQDADCDTGQVCESTVCVMSKAAPPPPATGSETAPADEAAQVSSVPPPAGAPPAAPAPTP